MPTILQLPVATEVTAADEVPISQAGITRSASVGTMLAGMQPAIMTATGTLLGRISLGEGGPEQIAIGTGLALNAGTLTANIGTVSGGPSGGAGSGSSDSYSIGGLAAVTSIASGDLVAISQGGTDHTVSYANFIDGLTIDLAQPALPAMDTDTFWVAQGSSTMLRQTFAAIWNWHISKQPSYKLPVVEITTNTTLDGTVHNGRILICSQPITLSPAAQNMGSGFYCDVLNMSSGYVTFGSGISTSSGTNTLPSGQAAALRVATYSGGTVVFASMGGSGGSGEGSPPAVPGQVTGLTASGPTSNSINLGWSVPGSGGLVSSYTVQYRVTGTTPWSTFATGLGAISTSVISLATATSYDFQVYAVNGGGAGVPSSVVTASTSAAAGSVTAVTWNIWPSGSYVRGSGSIGVNAHITPGTAAVRFGFANSATVPPASWVAATYVNTDLWGAYVSTPATAGTWYAWVEGIDGSKPTVYPTPFTVT